MTKTYLVEVKKTCSLRNTVLWFSGSRIAAVWLFLLGCKRIFPLWNDQRKAVECVKIKTKAESCSVQSRGETRTCFGGCCRWVGTVRYSLLLSRKAGARARWGGFDWSRELSSLLLRHLHTLVADLLSWQSLVRQHHRRRRCVSLIKTEAHFPVILWLPALGKKSVTAGWFWWNHLKCVCLTPKGKITRTKMTQP